MRACRCKALSFARCGLLYVNFCGTMLAGADVSTSEIGGWTLTDGAPELRGVTVTPVQAVELAERLGLIITKQQGENEAL